MRFKVIAIDTNYDITPPVVKGQVYEVVGETSTHYQNKPPVKEYEIEIEDYDIWTGYSSFNKYTVPAGLFELWVPEKPKKCTCGQDASWLHYHKRTCPSDKHSSWCEVYKP